MPRLAAREDRIRKKFNRYFFGPGADQPASYDLVVNTARFPIDETVALMRDLMTSTEPFQPPRHGSYAVLTLARELGAGEQGFAPPLAERLGLQVLERELLEEESRELGIPVAEVGRLDEMPAGILQRFRPGSIQHRYVDRLERLMQQYATRGNVLILGRGGFVFLRDHPTAFHVRLVAPMPVRVRRMMEYRWVREDVARRLLTQSDVRRRTFCLDFLSADWVSPLGVSSHGKYGSPGAGCSGCGGERRHTILGPQPLGTRCDRPARAQANLSELDAGLVARQRPWQVGSNSEERLVSTCGRMTIREHLDLAGVTADQ